MINKDNNAHAKNKKNSANIKKATHKKEGWE